MDANRECFLKRSRNIRTHYDASLGQWVASYHFSSQDETISCFQSTENKAYNECAEALMEEGGFGCVFPGLFDEDV